MRDVYETIEYRGHTIETGFESDDLGHFDPRDNDGNVGTMDVAIRNHTYGDEQTDPDSMRVTCDWCEGEGTVRIPCVGVREDRAFGYFDPSYADCPKCLGDGDCADPVKWAIEQGATVVLPIYAYIHSGTTFRVGTRLHPPTESKGGNPFSCPWDSGMAGIIYDTPEGVRSAFGVEEVGEGGKYHFTGKYHTEDGQHPSIERIEESLAGEVRVYDDYLTGQIMWWRTEGPSDDDGCGGYFPDETGSHGYMEDEARASIDSGIAYAWKLGVEELVEQQKIARVMAL